MINWLDLAGVYIGISLRGNVNPLGIDVAIAGSSGVTNQALPCKRSQVLPLRRRECQNALLKVNDFVHKVKYSASGAAEN
jgi:hypothetical protein